MPYKDKNKRREYQKNYQHIWINKLNPEELRTRRSKYNNTSKENGCFKRYYKKNSKKVIKNAINRYKNENLKWRVGMITRLNWEKDKKCGICKSTTKLHHHHWRYRLPVQRGDFSTLCTYCHGVQHGKRRLI